ncbi:hypothetical protein [Mastigocoleus testarum]|nr:hypothetical protein [Mastigocoleus testarum]
MSNVSVSGARQRTVISNKSGVRIFIIPITNYQLPITHYPLPITT